MFRRNEFTRNLGFSLSHPFAELRDYGLHEGSDYAHHMYKKCKIMNLFDGILFKVEQDDYYYGKKLVIRHNPKFVGGVNESFFSAYCHLYEFDWEVEKKSASERFIKAGMIIGKMGNSWTKANSSEGNLYRKVTENEIKDPSCRAGVHLHLMLYQVASLGEKTKLLNHMIKLGLAPKHLDTKCYFWQWGKLFYRDTLLFRYFKVLQKGKQMGI